MVGSPRRPPGAQMSRDGCPDAPRQMPGSTASPQSGCCKGSRAAKTPGLLALPDHRDLWSPDPPPPMACGHYLGLSRAAKTRSLLALPSPRSLWSLSGLSPLPSMHQLEGFVDLVKGQSVSHELVHFDLLAHVFGHQLGDTLHALPAWKEDTSRTIAASAHSSVGGRLRASRRRDGQGFLSGFLCDTKIHSNLI